MITLNPPRYGPKIIPNNGASYLINEKEADSPIMVLGNYSKYGYIAAKMLLLRFVL
jgi:hypothetical protein